MTTRSHPWLAIGARSVLPYLLGLTAACSSGSTERLDAASEAHVDVGPVSETEATAPIDTFLDSAPDTLSATETSDASTPGADVLVLPVALEGDALVTSLGAAGCLDLCDWIDTELFDESVEGACFDLDNCLDICAVLNQRIDRPCEMTRAEFATCMDAGSKSPCDHSKGSLPPECSVILTCLLPNEATRISDAGYETMVTLCQAMNEAQGVSSLGAEPAWAPCLFALQGFACRCGTQEPAQPECSATIGDAAACIELARPGFLPNGKGCAPFQVQGAGDYGHDARLVDLDCMQRRRLCQDAIPEQGNLVTSSSCMNQNANTHADYESPVEACVASIASLRCQCASNPTGAGCDAGVDQLESCVEGSYVGGCAYLADGSCIAPGNSASGIPGGAKISEASPDLLEQWCSWRVCLGGGPGYAGNGCTHAVFATRVPTVSECVADLAYHFSSCDVTIGDVEACLHDVHKNDSCERLATFGACTSSLENYYSTYVACHYLYCAACEPIVDCLIRGWDIPVDPPFNY